MGLAPLAAERDFQAIETTPRLIGRREDALFAQRPFFASNILALAFRAAFRVHGGWQWVPAA